MAMTTQKYPAETPLSFRLLAAPRLRRLMKPSTVDGDGRGIPSDGTEVVVARELSVQLLSDLFQNRILALHLKGFCSEQVCDLIAKNALENKLTNLPILDAEVGLKDTDVETIDRTDYDLREFASPFACPLDQVRVLLDENWRYGLKAGTDGDGKSHPGQFRIMHDTAPAQEVPLNCHADSSPILRSRSGVFSINVYVRPPTNGGQLYVWNPRFRLHRHFTVAYNFIFGPNYMNEQIQRYFQRLLPTPSVLKVAKGDVVIINTGRPHAIGPMQGGPRVSLQAFVRYRKNRPLEIY